MHLLRGTKDHTGRSPGAYTLIELVVVIALLAILATLTFPRAVRSFRQAPIDKAVQVLRQACETARLRAVLSSRICLVRIRAADGLVEIAQPPALPDSSQITHQTEVIDQSPSQHTQNRLPEFRDWIPEEVAFRELIINGESRMQAEEAFIAFYPNGTCDAFTALLVDIEGERREVKTDIVTGKLQIVYVQ